MNQISKLVVVIDVYFCKILLGFPTSNIEHY